MFTLPLNPTVVVLLDNDGLVSKVASNVSDDVTLQITSSEREYEELRKGKPFEQQCNNN